MLGSGGSIRSITASAWIRAKSFKQQTESALAHQRGRLELPLQPEKWFTFALHGSGIELLPLNEAIALRAVALSDIHRDPFDRIIIATALQLDAGLVSVDGHFLKYPELKGILLK